MHAWITQVKQVKIVACSRTCACMVTVIDGMRGPSRPGIHDGNGIPLD